MARRSRFVRPPARSSVWIGLSLAETSVAAGPNNQLLATLNAAALALRPFTIVRTRFQVNYESDQAAVSEFPTGALGFIVANDQAVAAGGGSIPGPVTNSDAPFFVWEGLHGPFTFLDSTGFQQGGTDQRSVDSKAMRKVGNNEDMVIMMGQLSAVGALIAIQGRMLVKLH